MRTIFLACILLLGIASGVVHAQTYDLQFVEVQNTGTQYDVKVQMKSNGATFKMGSGNLVFTYNTAALSTPTLLSTANFSGTFYSPMTVTQPASGRVSMNIELLLPGFGTTVPGTYLDVATIRFNILNLASTTGLVWRTVSPNATNAFQDDNSTLVPAGTLHSFDEPLPIQLSSFAAYVTGQNDVRLEWSTVSETNNFGFEVQKAQNQPHDFTTVPNSFVAGNGTTVEPHEYSFVDPATPQGTWFYRLKQIDLDGTIHYTEAIQVDVLSGVEEAGSIPATLALDQNYPNPFNPSTMIKFALPQQSHVTLEVFNVIGERVAMLINGVKPAGYHAVNFDAVKLASGLYIYRLSTADMTIVRKMTLVR